MGEIYVDGQLVTGAFIDGIEVDEIWIDGCVIAFEQLIRTGWQTVSGGSGTASINLSEANQVLQAGIRFRGTSSSSDPAWTRWGSSASTGWTGNSLATATPDRPTPSPPFGCQSGSILGWQIRIYCTRSNSSYYTGTASSGCGDSASFVFPVFPSTQLAPGFGNVCTSTGSVWGRVRSNSSDSNDQVRGAVQARTRYTRVCNSAMNNRDVSFPGPWTGTYSFWLSQGSLAPSSSGTQIDHKDDDTGDWFYAVPFPDSAFIAGQNNTVTLHNIDGSGSVQVELFAVYR